MFFPHNSAEELKPARWKIDIELNALDNLHRVNVQSVEAAQEWGLWPSLSQSLLTVARSSRLARFFLVASVQYGFQLQNLECDGVDHF